METAATDQTTGEKEPEDQTDTESTALKADELEEVAAIAAGFDYEIPPLADNEVEVEDHLRCIAYWRQKREERRQHGLKMVLKAKQWMEDQERLCVQREDWHKYGISCYLHVRHKTRLNLVHGNVSLIEGKERVVFSDTELEHFITVAPSACVGKKFWPLKDEIMKHIKATGELLPGVEIVKGGEVLRVSLKA